MLRVCRFLHSFVRETVGRVESREISLEVNGAEVPASYIRPHGDHPLPGWIVLHGITVPGRDHPVLRRFAHALASTGAAVMIPEVPAWRRLELDPSMGDATIEATANHLVSRSDVTGANLNLVGFSFGATQALMSATRPGIARSVRAVVGFGGYCDLGRTVRFMMTGEHEWQRVTRRLDPDPYGRWIVVGNYLTEVPEFAHMVELQRAARELALEAGRLGAYAADPLYDPIKARLREQLPAEQRELWDIFAPPQGVRPSLEESRILAAKLIEATVRKHPDLDPQPVLPYIDQKVVLVHGHDDRLIPYTETLRLRSHLSPGTNVTASITRLFAHSREADRLSALEYPRELARYFALLRRALQPC
jgi:pimeloyl-ACP methyl ester carboxylesterase